MDNERIKNERALIYLLLHNKDSIDRFYNYGLSEKHFCEEHVYIVSSILKSYDQDNVLLTRTSFKEKLKKYKIPKEKISYEVNFNLCFSSVTKIDDFPFLANKIVENKVKESVGESLENFKNNASSKDYIHAVKNLIVDCEEIVGGVGSSRENTYYDDISEMSSREIQYLKDVRDGKIEEEPRILTGIREMDHTMVTGLEKGTLTLICADVGGYKSTMMLNIGLNVWRNGFNVLYVPLEMSIEQMWRRINAREAKIKLDKLTRRVKDLTDDEFCRMEKVKEEMKNGPFKFYMMEKHGGTSVIAIQREIERKIEVFKPDIVVIDYIANLEAHKERYGRNDLEIGDMLKSLRQGGKDWGYAVLSAAQLGREALKRIRKTGGNKDKVSINSEDIRGSHEYSADADNIFAQLKNSSQPNELLDIFCVKSRNGPTVFEGGEIKATLHITPEYGLIVSPPKYEMADGPDENIDKYDADLGDLMDKAEGDESITDNDILDEKISNDNDDDFFNDDDDFFNDNKDIEESIGD
jgi:replicative DNA helicase